MRKSVFVVLLLLAALAPGMVERAVAQPPGWVPDSCLVLWQYSPLDPNPPGSFWWNPDSVTVDVCQDSEYLQEYAIDFVATFQYYIIHVPDSVALNGMDTALHTWHDIDTTFSNLRLGFAKIEKLFGTFTLRHVNYGPGDTSVAGNKQWSIKFSRYVNIDSTDTALTRLPDLNPFLGPPYAPTPWWDYYSVHAAASAQEIRVLPQPCDRDVKIFGSTIPKSFLFFDALGREITLPVTLSDNVLTVNVSKQPNGVLYFIDSDHIIKILIQHEP